MCDHFKSRKQYSTRQCSNLENQLGNPKKKMTHSEIGTHCKFTDQTAFLESKDIRHRNHVASAFGQRHHVSMMSLLVSVYLLMMS